MGVDHYQEGRDTCYSGRQPVSAGLFYHRQDYNDYMRGWNDEQAVNQQVQKTHAVRVQQLIDSGMNERMAYIKVRGEIRDAEYNKEKGHG